MYDVNLIAKTMPTEEFISESGAEDANDIISYCARVSNPGNQDSFDTAEKLLRYCVRKQHWSIFEMADLVMEIHTTRDIGRQILRHRSFSFQEFSQRYAEVTDPMYIRECRFQDAKNRQSSREVDLGSEVDVSLRIQWLQKQQAIADLVQETYAWAVKYNIAKEQARVILSEGMTPSVMYMKGNIRSWMHYAFLRTDMGTQKEHRIVAQNVYDILAKEFPFVKEIKVSE